MKITRLLFLVIAIVVLSVPALAQGVKISPAAGHFSVTFPGSAEVPEKAETKTGTGPAYPYTTHLFLQRDGEPLYLAGWVDYNPSFNFGPRAEMVANRDNFLKGVGGTLVSEKNIKLASYDGIEFVGDIKGQRSVTGRVYIIAKRPILFIVVAPTGTHGEDIAAFLNSVKLTK
jgi:hypothetical protein